VALCLMQRGANVNHRDDVCIDCLLLSCCLALKGLFCSFFLCGCEIS